jgi:hypothetical protein
MSRSSCVQGARLELLRAMTVAPVSMQPEPITPADALQEEQACEPEAEQFSPGHDMNGSDPQPARADFLQPPAMEEEDTALGFAAAPAFDLGQGRQRGIDKMMKRAIVRR